MQKEELNAHRWWRGSLALQHLFFLQVGCYETMVSPENIFTVLCIENLCKMATCECFTTGN